MNPQVYNEDKAPQTQVGFVNNCLQLICKQAMITNISDDWRKNISPRVKIDLVRKIISALSPALSFVESPEQYQMFHTAFRQAQEVNISSKS